MQISTPKYFNLNICFYICALYLQFYILHAVFYVVLFLYRINRNSLLHKIILLHFEIDFVLKCVFWTIHTFWWSREGALQCPWE